MTASTLAFLVDFVCNGFSIICQTGFSVHGSVEREVKVSVLDLTRMTVNYDIRGSTISGHASFMFKVCMFYICRFNNISFKFVFWQSRGIVMFKNDVRGCFVRNFGAVRTQSFTDWLRSVIAVVLGLKEIPNVRAKHKQYTQGHCICLPLSPHHRRLHSIVYITPMRSRKLQVQ